MQRVIDLEITVAITENKWIIKINYFESGSIENGQILTLKEIEPINLKQDISFTFFKFTKDPNKIYKCYNITESSNCNL